MRRHPESGAVFYAKMSDLARFPGSRWQGLDRAAICITIRTWKRRASIERLKGLRSARAGLPRVPLRELLRPLGGSCDVLLASLPPSPRLQHLGVSHVSQVSQDLPPNRCAVGWRDSLTGFCALG